MIKEKAYKLDFSLDIIVDMNTLISERGTSEADVAGKMLSDSSISRREREYNEAIRKARVWASLGQLIEAQKNRVISRETLENLRKAKRE